MSSRQEQASARAALEHDQLWGTREPGITVGAARVLRYLVLKDDSFRKQFEKCAKDAKVNADRSSKAVLFSYIIANPLDGRLYPEESGKLLREVLPQVFSHFLAPKKKTTKEGEYDEMKWAIRLFAITYSTGVDQFLWDCGAPGRGNPEERIENALRVNRRYLDAFDLVVPEIVRSTYKLTHQLCLDRALNCNVNRFRDEMSLAWYNIRYINSMFMFHPNITQPVMLAAVLYTAITRPKKRGEETIRNSTQLKRRYPALHRLFYMVLECAQITSDPGMSKLRRMEECDVYAEDRGQQQRTKSKNNNKSANNNNKPAASTSTNSGGAFGSPKLSNPPSENGTYDGPVVRINNTDKRRPVAVVCNYKLPRRIKERETECSVWLISDLPFHICCHSKYFVEMEKPENLALVRHKWGEVPFKDSFHRVDGIGTVKVRFRNMKTNVFVTVTLKNIYYVPSLKSNIMSLPQLGANVKYDSGSLEMDFNDTDIIDPPEKKIFLKSMLQNRYCFFDYSRGQDFSKQLNEIPDIQHALKSQGLIKMTYVEDF